MLVPPTSSSTYAFLHVRALVTSMSPFTLHIHIFTVCICVHVYMYVMNITPCVEVRRQLVAESVFFFCVGLGLVMPLVLTALPAELSCWPGSVCKAVNLCIIYYTDQ